MPTIEGFASAEPGYDADIMTMGIRRSDWGQRNGTAQLEFWSFEASSVGPDVTLPVPDNVMVIDRKAALKIIHGLANVFGINLDVTRKD
jgi:hypothetical protein